MQGEKRAAEDVVDRDHKRQRRCEEPITIHFPQPTTAESSRSAIDTIQILHDSTPLDTSNSPPKDTASSLARHLGHEHIPDMDDTPISGPTCRLSKAAIPSKRRNPFTGGGPRKKMKTERYVTVRVYAQREDLECTHEIQCSLTQDGGLDLAGLSQKLKFKECQVSHSTTSPRVGRADHPLKVLDTRSRPWFSKHPILERGAINLLKEKDGYLRVVCQ